MAFLGTPDERAFLDALEQEGTIRGACRICAIDHHHVSSIIRQHLVRGKSAVLYKQHAVRSWAARRSFLVLMNEALARHYENKAADLEALPTPRYERPPNQVQALKDRVRELEGAQGRDKSRPVPDRAPTRRNTTPNAPATRTGGQGRRRAGRAPAFMDLENPYSEKFTDAIEAEAAAWQPGDPVPDGFEEHGFQLVDIR